MSRIFLSHSNRDMREAVALKQWLAEQDPPLANEIFLDVDPESGLRTGMRWKDALRRANARCEAVICLLSANWEASHECKVEYRTAENLNKQIFCARLEPSTGDELTSEWQRCDLFGAGPTTKVDVDNGPPVEFATAGLYRLRDGIRGAGIGAESFVWPPPGDAARAPYRGWEPLDEADAAVFFGRDAQIIRALDAMRGMRLAGVNQLFVVLGPSGTGKSSFLRAGLLPRLRREDRRFVLLNIVRPERNSLTGTTGLAAALSATRLSLGLTEPSLGEIKELCASGDVAAVAGLLADVRQVAARRLVERGGDVDDSAAPTLVLPVDQAEELFSADAGKSAADFLDLLAGLTRQLNTQDLGLVVAATIRTDRYEVMQTHPSLAGMGTVLFDELKPMPPTQFKEVIAGPARRASEAGRPLGVAPELVDRLLADAAEGADTLPILALTLSRLYTDYASTGELTLARYEALGGMRRVVQTEIDEVLSPDPVRRGTQLAALRAAFIPWLATINPDNDQPMRRVARWSDLPDASRPLIDELVSKRLMVKDTRDGDAVVEVALESLLRQWDELAGWLREERQDLKAADDLERASAAWAASEHNPAWLLEGSRLTEATRLVNLPGFRDRLASAHQYLNASHQRENQRRTTQEQQRQAELNAAYERAQHAQERQATAEAHAATMRKRSRVLRAVLALTVVVGVVAGIGFVWANAANNEAQERFRQATGLRLTSEAQGVVDGSRPGSVTQAIQQVLAARQLTPTPDDDMLYSLAVRGVNIVKIIDTPGDVTSVEYSPDGDRLATSGREGAVHVWDAESGQPVGKPLTGHDGRIADVAYSPDGTQLASGGGDHTVRLWDPETGQQIKQFDGNTEAVFQVVFSPDGRRLAAVGSDKTLRIWDIDSGDLVRAIPTGHQDTVTTLAFSPDSRLLLTGSDDKTVRLWNPDNGAPVGDPIVEPTGMVNSVAFSPDGRRFAAGGDGVLVWDTATRQRVGEPITGHTNTVSAVTFGPDGRQLATASADSTVQVWDTETGTPAMPPLYGHNSTVFGVAFSPDGRRLASGSRDGTMRIWNTVAGQPMHGHSDQVREVAYSPDGNLLASVSKDATLRLWDPQSGAPLGEPLRTEIGLESVAFSRDGKRLAAGDDAGVVHMWDTASRRPLSSIDTGQDASIRNVTFSSDGTAISVLDWGEVATVWNVDAGTQRGENVGETKALGLDADWRLAASSSGNDAHLLDLVDGEEIGDPLVGHTNSIRRLTFSPDARLLASASDDTTVRLWDTESAKPFGEPLTGHIDSVFDVEFSPDGKRLASAGGDTVVRMWDVGTGRQIGEPLTGHQDKVISVAFRPDGQSLASASNDGHVRLWPATASPEDLCDKLTANMSRKQWNEWVSPDIDYITTCPDLPVAAD